MTTQTPLRSLEGILLVDKPMGCTSHKVVERLRRKLRMKRIGHAGTLDPIATGLLIVLVGKATKLSQFLMNLDKDYEGTILLGQSTDTHDGEGVIEEEKTVPDLDETKVEGYLKQFLGDQNQIPPMFSAKKINGLPLYKLARKGKVTERQPRLIRIFAFDLLNLYLPKLDFHISCSKGTYVRTMAHDLGQKIGCGAHLTALRRTAIERFDLAQATPLEQIETMTEIEIQRLLIPGYQAIPSQLL